ARPDTGQGDAAGMGAGPDASDPDFPDTDPGLSPPDSLATVVPPSSPLIPSLEIPMDSGPRFRVLHHHDSGGLGHVFLARDEELQRDVALKEMKGRWAHHPPSRARFLLEATITGGLEHPGVVPVYGLGTYRDGRPYYAMRFIRGDSLLHAIRRLH